MDNFKKLYEAATLAAKHAYTPYSNFQVGAALESKSGEIYSGGNIENASYSLTCCAERVTIFKAVSSGVTDFKTFVITSDTKEPISPCGACRQVMSEFFDENVDIILTNNKGNKKVINIHELLPYSFNL
ncbi:MAG TPA: cytidine deaminase [Pseudogracilibacillus sp.]|nr:cytidine deaminase [Pseudogracilibacillus sp.]